MTELRFMMMDWERFFSSERVRRMPTATQGIYCLTLGKMWLNGGWLPVNDVLIARMIGLDVRTWLRTYKEPIVATFATRTDAILDAVYVQDVLQDVRQSSQAIHAKNVAAAARARAGKAAKSRARASTPEPKKPSRPEPAPAPAAELQQGTKGQEQKEESSPIKTGESFLPATSARLGALHLREFGEEGPVASPAVEGSAATGPSFPASSRAPPAPLSPGLTEALARSQPPDDAAPSSALLNTRIVKRSKGNGHEMDPEHAPPEGTGHNHDERDDPPKPKSLGTIADQLAAYRPTEGGEKGE